jgi:hypothetical protein
LPPHAAAFLVARILLRIRLSTIHPQIGTCYQQGPLARFSRRRGTFSSDSHADCRLQGLPRAPLGCIRMEPVS